MKIEEFRNLMRIPFDAINIENRFNQIAEILKKCCVIEFENEEYRILDFEFYFYNKTIEIFRFIPGSLMLYAGTSTILEE